MLTIGCHLSSSKGYLAMGKEAVSIGANTFQFFTRNPRGNLCIIIGIHFQFLFTVKSNSAF